MTVDAPTAAYRALAAELRRAILGGEVPPNHRLPTESELAAERGLSRQTVRQAFRELVAESLVYRIPGRGSFVSPIAAHGTYLRSFGSIDDLLALSVDTQVEVAEPFRMQTDAAAAARLQLPTDQVMTGVVRRLHDGVVFCATTVHLPLELGRRIASVAELAQAGRRSTATVIGLLERVARVPIAGAQQSVVAVAATEDVARLVECDAGSPVLRIDRLYSDRSGRPVELAVSHFHPDRYSYRLEIRRSPR
jgi:DNA-binding GntR family transcriptional regulator